MDEGERGRPGDKETGGLRDEETRRGKDEVNWLMEIVIFRQYEDYKFDHVKPVGDTYPYSEEKQRNYYNRYLSGEKLNAGWIEKTDVEQPSSVK